MASVRGTRVLLLSLAVGLLALWAAAFASPAMALPSDCSQSGPTVTCAFSSTGSEQSLAVPAGVASVHVVAVGAPGGAGEPQGPSTPGGTGGFGARVESDLPVAPGEVLFIEVGGSGNDGSATTNRGAGGFNGGGSGNNGIFSGGGGGGATDIRTCSMLAASCTSAANTLSSRLLVAAGGGGGGALNGGGGGGAADMNGLDGASPFGCPPGGGGGAGTQTGGGAGGTAGSGTGAVAGNPGVAGKGGDVPSSFTAEPGGGGGGGYFGGGAGGTSNGCTGGGGGGGSSYVGSLTGSSVTTDTTGTPELVVSYTLAATSTSVSAPATGVTGTAIAASSISATLSGATSAASGTITFTVFGPQSSSPTTCTSGGTKVGTATVSGNGTYHPSAGFTPGSVGTYYWYASYSGDGGNQSSNSGCGAGMKSTVVGKAPTAVTGSATNVTGTSATLNGTVSPNGLATTYYFQYGASTGYGHQTSATSAGSDTTTHTESVSISGLVPGKTYHFRIVAQNAGGTSYGADRTFTTPKRSLGLSVFPTHTLAGTHVCVQFKASSNGPVAGVTVRFAGRSVRTSHEGHATVCLTLQQGTYRATATKAGFRAAHAAVTVTAPPKPKFTG